MIPIINTIISNSSWILAQSFIQPVLDTVGGDLGSSLLNFIKAFLILIVGWIIAVIAKNVTKKLLDSTDIDNKIAQWVSGSSEEKSLPIELWISEAVYWFILLFALIAFLNAIELDAVSQPLNTLLDQTTKFIPQIAAAALLLALAWLTATIVKLLVTRTLTALKIDQRFGQDIGENQFVLSENIGNALYWFIFLLFLPSILSTLQLEGTLVPVQDLLNEILAILPNVLAAVIIGMTGWVVAQIVSKIVVNLLAAGGIDQIGAKFGFSGAGERQSLSQIIGTIVYALILITISITALDALQIKAISEPAIAMLNQVLNVLPKIFAASVILIFAYIAGQYISELVTNILTSIGFNNIFQWLGMSALSKIVDTAPNGDEETQTTVAIKSKTPSELIGIIILVAIMLVASLTAVDILQIAALKEIVGAILLIAGQVVIALLVFAVGLYFANLAFQLIASSGTRQAKILAQTARIAIITLVSAMALQEMGIAPNIVNLAFGLLLGSIAVAMAIAFGLGSKDIAAEQLKEWIDSFKRN